MASIYSHFTYHCSHFHTYTICNMGDCPTLILLPEPVPDTSTEAVQQRYMRCPWCYRKGTDLFLQLWQGNKERSSRSAGVPRLVRIFLVQVVLGVGSIVQADILLHIVIYFLCSTSGRDQGDVWSSLPFRAGSSLVALLSCFSCAVRYEFSVPLNYTFI